MASLKKIVAARQNGARSRGPKTPAGKLRSSLNALTHGLTAKTVVLNGEDPDRFLQLLRAFHEKFQPSGDVETAHVHQMAASLWKLHRLWGIETDLYNLELDLIFPSFKDAFLQTPANHQRIALAFKSFHKSSPRTAASLERHQASLLRQYERAYLLFLSMRSTSFGDTPPIEPKFTILQNDPNQSPNLLSFPNNSQQEDSEKC